ncbi:unnamed protein product [Urochloa decumbens]|uniref:RRM domain-containing protein n=1 Tax=Urochloa decumbens TaxID=240449 RepID=A0ABC9ETQ8_9POAL
MELSQPLRADAMPYIPLVAFICPPPMAQLPSPPFFPLTPPPYQYQAPPPQAAFRGCGAVPIGGVVMQGAFPHPPPWAPLTPVSHGAIPMPAATAMPLAGDITHAPRSVRAPGARPPPRLDVPPRMQRRARPGPGASRGGEAAGAGGGNGAAKEEPAPGCGGGGAKASGAGEEAAANEPSPRSVLVTPSPPISPTTSLPSSFCPPPASAAPTKEARSPNTAASRPAGPPERRRWQRVGPRRAQRLAAPDCEARRGVPKPRLLYDPACTRTSLMVRNIPNDFTRKRLMSIIDEHCFIENQKVVPGGVKSEYDFLYVPIDFQTLANKGYAFVNMTSPEAARRLWKHLHGHRWEVGRCLKTCAVDYAAKQGLEKLRDHFSESSFNCETEEFLPAWFEPPRDGTRPAEGVLHVVGGLRRRS